jgi:spore germination protein GerM
MRCRFLLLLTMVLSVVLLASCATGQQPTKQDNDNLNWFNRLDEEEPETAANDQHNDDSLYRIEAMRQTGYNLYFLDESAGQLAPEVHRLSGEYSSEEQIEHIVQDLIEGPSSSELLSTLPKDVKVNRVELTEGIVLIDLSSEFYHSEDLSLARAALVNTILELGSAKYVKLLVDGNEATVTPDHTSGVVGLLTRYPVNTTDIQAFEAQSFANTEAAKINRELYFQDSAGNYLLPEVRAITVKDGNYSEAIIKELIKGPANEGMGLYPTLAKGTRLERTEIVKKDDKNTGINLYFTNEFKSQFTGGRKQEAIMISSIVYSLSTLPDFNFINVYYDNGNGVFVNKSDGKFDYQNLTADRFPDKVGKRIRVYYGDEQGTLLVPEYRAVSTTETDLLNRILMEMTTKPILPGSVGLIPADFSHEDIQVKAYGNVAVVDISIDYFDTMQKDNKRLLQGLYAVVNTLTDPMNSCGVSEVQFTIEGDLIDSYDDISLKEPFVMNPGLVKEGP